MSRLRQYARDVGALVSQSLVQRIFGMVTTVVLARMLGPSGLGVYSAVVNTASSAYGFVRLGVDAAIHVHTADAREDEEARRVKSDLLAAGFALLSGCGIVGAIACLLLSGWLAEIVYGQRELARYLGVAGALVFVQCLSQFCFATLAGLHWFQTYAKVMALSAIMSTIIIYIGIVLGELTGAILANVFVQVCTLLYLATATKRALAGSALHIRLRKFTESAAVLLRLGFPFYASGLIGIPITYLVQGMLSREHGLEALGQLRAIAAIMAIVSFVPSSAAAAMISWLTRARSEDKRQFMDYTARNLKLVWVFAIVSVTAIATVVPWLFDSFFGSDYILAAKSTNIALLSAMCACVIGTMSNACLSAKRIDLLFFYTTAYAVTFLGASVFFIPAWGLWGYLIAELLAYSGVLFLACWHGGRWFADNGFDLTWFVPISTLTAFVYAALISVSELRLPNIHVALAGLAVFCITAVFSYRSVLNEQEQQTLKRVITRFS